MAFLDKDLKVEILVFAAMLLVCYILSAFISFSIKWFIDCSALARGGFVFGWVASSLILLYQIEK